MPGAWQVIHRAKEMWAEDAHWSTLSYRMEFAEGDFFRPGMGTSLLGLVQPHHAYWNTWLNKRCVGLSRDMLDSAGICKNSMSGKNEWLECCRLPT